MNTQTQANTETVDLAAILAEMATLRAQNAAMKAASVRKMSFKVTEKGGLSVYGLGRFPVSLYRGQWERLLGAKEDILAFISANAGSLSVKE